MEEARKIWLDGKLIDWKDANVHVLTHTLHYGLGVFEGIRCYKTDNGSQIFRLREHIRRLFDSAHIVRIDIPFEQDEILAAVRQTVRENELESCYIRPLVYLGYGVMGINPIEAPVHVAIAAWSWGSYLGDEGLQNGIRLKTSSFTRHHVNSHMNRAKICGAYTNSILAKREAIECGYDEAMMLDANGFVAEGSGENIFVIRDNKVVTPSAASILPGITRETVMILLADIGIKVEERLVTRDDMYIADEVFMVGTAAEITPIKEIDQRVIGAGGVGPLTKKVQQIYFDVMAGRLPKYQKWLDFV